jgi:hypothetical protein
MKNRVTYISLALITIVLGLLSRASFVGLPSYVGDVLWAVMVFWIIYAVFPKMTRLKIALFALLFSYSIELLQLYHAVWIEQIRHTLLGGLVLGFSFSFSDMVYYTIGVVFALALDWKFNR